MKRKQPKKKDCDYRMGGFVNYCIYVVYSEMKSLELVHPFGCLISHVGGRGVLKALHERFPEAKITSIEYDYDQSDTLRESRVLLAIE